MNLSTLWLVALAGLAPVASAQSFDAVSIQRNVTVDASVIDRDDADSDIVTALSNANGLFAEQVATSVLSTNFRTSGGAAADQQSFAALNGIEIFGRAEASAFGADYEGGADIVSTTASTSTITVNETTRIAIVAFVFSDNDRSVATVASGNVSLTDANGNDLFAFTVVGDEDETEFEGWSPPRTITVSVDANVRKQFSGAINDEQDRFGDFCEAEVEGAITPYNAADYNLSGDVTQADKDAFLVAWRARNIIADFNGDGVVDRDDRRGYNRAFRRATR